MARAKGIFSARIEYLFARMFFSMFRVLPLDLSLRLGEEMGRRLSRFFSKRKKIAMTNLGIVFPQLSDEEKMKVYRASFASLGRQIAMTVQLSRSDRPVDQLFDVQGLEHFRKAKADGQAVILLSGHIGGWELFVTVAPVFCRSAEVVFRPLDNALLDTYVQKLRSRFGTRLHGRGSGARTRLDDALATGSNIIVLPDVNWQERGGTFVDFFGRPASTATSVAELAIRHEAAIVPAFVLWNEEKRRYSFIFGSTLKTPVNGAEGPQNLTQAATSAIESVIRKNPEQWHWYHRRWKTRPPGEPPIY